MCRERGDLAGPVGFEPTTIRVLATPSYKIREMGVRCGTE